MRYKLIKFPALFTITLANYNGPGRQIWYFYQLLLNKEKNSDLIYFRNAGAKVLHLVLRLFSNSTPASYRISGRVALFKICIKKSFEIQSLDITMELNNKIGFLRFQIVIKRNN